MAGKYTWKKGRVLSVFKYDQTVASETVLVVKIKEKNTILRYEWIRKNEVEEDAKFDSAWEKIHEGDIVRVYFVDNKFSHIVILK